MIKRGKRRFGNVEISLLVILVEMPALPHSPQRLDGAYNNPVSEVTSMWMCITSSESLQYVTRYREQ